MIGGIRRGLASVLAAASMAAMPDLGQQRTLTSRPGSGLVRATGRPKPKRDSERQMRAVIKRRRKDAKRREDMGRCHLRNSCLWWVQGSPASRKWVAHGC